MGETENQFFRLSFNLSLKVNFQGSRHTSDGGLILVRELDKRLGFSELIGQHLTAILEGGIRSFRLRIFCASSSTVEWRVMRMSTMPSGSRSIRRSG